MENTTTTVREAKTKLAALLEKLNRYDDNTPFSVEFDVTSKDHSLDTLEIGPGCDGAIWLTNF